MARTIILFITVLIITKTAFAGLTMCNETPDPMFVAIGITEAQRVTLAGWIELAPAHCTVAIKKSLSQSYLLVFARNQLGEKWSGTDQFCVADADFVVSGSDCPLSRLPTARFTRLYAGQENIAIAFAPHERITQTAGLHVISRGHLERTDVNSTQRVLAAFDATLKAESGIMEGNIDMSNGATIRYSARAGRPRVFASDKDIEIELPVSFEIGATRRIAGRMFVFGRCGARDPRVVELSFRTRFPEKSHAETTLTGVTFLKRCKMPIIGDVSEILEDQLRPEMQRLISVLDDEINHFH